MTKVFCFLSIFLLFRSSYLVVIALSEDHKLSVSDSERRRVEQMGVHLNPNQTRLNGLAISRAFGDMFPKSVKSGIVGTPYTSDIISIPADNRARVILASDGVCEV